MTDIIIPSKYEVHTPQGQSFAPQTLAYLNNFSQGANITASMPMVNRAVASEMTKASEGATYVANLSKSSGPSVGGNGIGNA